MPDASGNVWNESPTKPATMQSIRRGELHSPNQPNPVPYIAAGSGEPPKDGEYPRRPKKNLAKNLQGFYKKFFKIRIYFLKFDFNNTHF